MQAKKASKNGSGPRGPLSHITVLDMTQFLAGPYGSQILGDLGARIIKIEPGDGDITRNTPPYFHLGESAYFLSVNRNKESLVLNLKEARGRELFLELVKKADIVLENYRPGVMKRLGIDYPALRAVNPRIVMCSISGFGQDGPYRDRPAYDIIIQAISGGMSLTGEEGGKPVRAGIPLADLSAGMFGAVSVLAGLAKVNATGEGAYYDVSMMDCQVSMLTYQAAYYLMSGEVPGLQGRGHRSLTTYRAYLCGDGIEIVVAANSEKMWESLCAVMGHPGLPQDPRFNNRKDRLKNRAQLDAILEAAFLDRKADDVLEELRKVQVPAAPINSLDRVFNDPQVQHRRMVLNVEDGQGGGVRLAGNPVKGEDCPARAEFPSHLGADSAAVLQDLLGLSAEQTRELTERGIIGAPPAKAA
jgi:crotonobetainyl-CoA:carnitine CoA-transferase CaiB-like acyl-CoA transferase